MRWSRQGSTGGLLLIGLMVCGTALTAKGAGKAPADMARLWGELASTDYVVVQRAADAFVGAGGASVHFLAKRLTLVKMSSGALQQLITKLDAEDYRARKQAADALALYGKAAAPILREALKVKSSIEVKAAIERLLGQLLLPYPASSECTRQIVAVRVLARIATPSARALLGKLTAGQSGAILTDEAIAAEKCLKAGKPVTAFDRLAVSLSGVFAGRSEFTIAGDGSVAAKMWGRGKQVESTSFKLETRHLTELERLLGRTQWLGRASPPRGATDQTTYAFALTRRGRSAKLSSYGVTEPVYKDLARFLDRLAYQERMLYRLTGSTRDDRRGACYELSYELQRNRGVLPIDEWYYRVLDYGRLLPFAHKTLSRPAEYAPPVLQMAARLVGHMRDTSQRQRLAELCRYVTPKDPKWARKDTSPSPSFVRRAAVEALVELGGEASWKIIADLADDPDYDCDVSSALVKLGGVRALPLLKLCLENKPSDEYAWQMIRMGRPATDHIVSILDSPVQGNGSAAYYILRNYCRDWFRAPRPIDARVAAAVGRFIKRSPSGSSRRNHAEMFLDLLNPDKGPSGAREAFEWVTGGLMAGTLDLAKGKHLAVGARDRSTFKTLADKARKHKLVVGRVLVGRDYAWANVAVAGAADKGADDQFMLRIRHHSGRDWQVQSVVWLEIGPDGKPVKYFMPDPKQRPDVIEIPPGPRPALISAAATTRAAPAGRSAENDKAARFTGDAAEVAAAAGRFLSAVRSRKGNAMKTMIVEVPPQWMKARMPAVARELTKAFAGRPECLTNIRDVLVRGNYAIVRVDGLRNSGEKYLVLLLQRRLSQPAQKGWWVRHAGDSPVGAPALTKLLDDHLARIKDMEGPIQPRLLAAQDLPGVWAALGATETGRAHQAVIRVVAAGEQGLGQLLTRASAPSKGERPDSEVFFDQSADVRRMVRLRWACELLGRNKDAETVRGLEVAHRGLKPGQSPSLVQVRPGTTTSGQGDLALAAYTHRRGFGMHPFSKDFISIVLNFREVIDAYPGTKAARYCSARLTAVYGAAGFHDWVQRDLLHATGVLAGTEAGQKAQMHLAIRYLQRHHNPAKAMEWLDKIDNSNAAAPDPSGAAPDARLRQMVRAQTAAKHKAQMLQLRSRCQQELAARSQADMTPWPKGTEGVQCRLRLAPSLKGRVRLLADFQNSGKRDLWWTDPSRGVEMEVDDQWYVASPTTQPVSQWFGPHCQRYNRRLSLGGYWRGKAGGKAMTLAPGKHTVRIAWTLAPGRDGGKSVRTVSNAVTVSIGG